MMQADGGDPEEAATSAASATQSIQEDIDEPVKAQQASATREAGAQQYEGETPFAALTGEDGSMVKMDQW
jgi:hypothetical protein